MQSVKRAFVDIREGQAHYRHAGDPSTGAVPLVMLHASPGSSRMLEPMIAYLAESRPVYAPDTLGNGDSPPPPDHSRHISTYADAHMRVINALGIEQFDLYGSHTGGSIACEIAITHPHRVRRLILDGMSCYEPEEIEDMLRQYAPGIEPDQNGMHVMWLWNFVRDSYLFWPWYKRGHENRLDSGLPSADRLHDMFVEVVKGARTYHLPYQSAFVYPKSERLPLVKVPTLLACAKDDVLAVYFDKVRALMPAAEACWTEGMASPEQACRTMDKMLDFLDR